MTCSGVEEVDLRFPGFVNNWAVEFGSHGNKVQSLQIDQAVQVGVANVFGDERAPCNDTYVRPAPIRPICWDLPVLRRG
jgi:hypothetical protein